MIDFNLIGETTADFILFDVFQIKKFKEDLLPAARVYTIENKITAEGFHPDVLEKLGVNFVSSIEHKYKTNNEVIRRILGINTTIDKKYDSRTYIFKTNIKYSSNKEQMMQMNLIYRFKRKQIFFKEAWFYNPYHNEVINIDEGDRIKFNEGFSNAFEKDSNKEFVEYFDNHFLGKAPLVKQ